MTAVSTRRAAVVRRGQAVSTRSTGHAGAGEAGGRARRGHDSPADLDRHGRDGGRASPPSGPRGRGAVTVTR
ncbi:hypothetical protein BL253_25205 [Pseudofrankia asymbiotica]|uniref:Uncharacterized protein n=1 Tax=Pseudofrankia asymbiotica TaxID=1834516 RepID=A0A1V2I5W3_9ACTN|nr:hypothetical protein BL253_25205 [Pseudofrankia asymbiotica]